MQIANGMTVLNALADETAQRTKAHADSLQEVAQGIRKAILSIQCDASARDASARARDG